MSASQKTSVAPDDVPYEWIELRGDPGAALLHDIAKQTPGYAVALHWAVEKYGFDVAVGTVRYNKRRDGCYTFGMPGRPVMAVWVDARDGSLVRAGPIDW
jgi:hypothetical protein